ncbi:MAG: DotA/TraY family protein [Amylibacter sp.]|nr:DotA/TraY family protein [Amylibacter sp.]
MSKENSNGQGLLSKDNAKALFRYAVKPDIIPRIRALGMHFGHFAYLIALVLNSARLIPQGHPSLQAANIGRFGVTQVLAIAANNIKWSLKNIDQIAIFGSIVTALIMIAIQAVVIALYALVGSASAASSPSEGFFTTPAENISTDVVLIFLEQVFGPNLNIFGAASQPLGTPIYEGLQKILGFYSMAMMVIAVIIVVYYILTVIGEAAQTGTPFGKRFNTLWAPIRLVIALGLLVPMASGLNTAQYLTLWTAKLGSGLGTQVWVKFAATFTEAKDIVSKPASGSTTGLVKRVFLSEVCAASYNQIEQGNPRKVKILQSLNGTSATPNFSNPQSMIDAAKANNMKSVILSWSSNTVCERANDYTCGYISINLADFDFFTDTGITETRDDTWWEWMWGGRDITNKIGQIHKSIRNEYITQINVIATTLRPSAIAIAAYKIPVNATANLNNRAVLDAAEVPAKLLLAATVAHNSVNAKIETSYEILTGSRLAKSDAYDEIIKRGWGAAGLWYGNLTKINQKYMDAVNASVPTLGTIIGAPSFNAGEKNVGFFASIFGSSRTSSDVLLKIDSAVLFAKTEYGDFILQSVPENSPLYQEAKNNAAGSGESGIAGALIWMLGGSELYDLKNNPTLDPMTRIAGAGHAMLFRSLLAFGAGSVMGVASFGTGVAGSIAGALPKVGKVPEIILKAISEMTGALASLFFTIAAIAVVAGIFLAYVIPLMPFIYFAFAIIAWILEIFEAVVAMPLWALAHLSIEGDGMPGQAAIQGYHLLLMILLRPALIVFGLIGGYVIFGAAMYFFSSLFNSATTITQQEITGNDVGGLGVFVYTMIFAFLTYNIAIMCFKMIDDVPKGILRWLGSSAQTFGDSRGDPINGAREVVIGAVAGGSALKSGVGQASGGLKSSASNTSRRIKDLGSKNKPKGKSPLRDPRDD